MQRPLTIAFDASCMATTQKAGVANYTAHLVLALAQRYPEDVRLIGHYCGWQSPAQLDLPQASNIAYRRSRLIPSRILNMLRRLGIWLPFELLTKTRADFHLFPAFIGWPSIFHTPSACVVHDLAYLEMPETVSAVNRHDLAKLVPITLKRSALVLTPSKATRNTLKQTYGGIVPPCLVTYIPPTNMTALKKTEAQVEIKQLRIPGKFILFVGTLEPRKNVVNLLQAYSMLPNDIRQSYALVLAGSLGWNSQEIAAALSHALKSKLPVMHTGYITNHQKAALYIQASLLVQPSLYEGFGMPILEAMSYGLPVIASDIPVFHEVAGEAAAYVNPHDSAALASVIERVLTDKSTYRNLKQKSERRTHQHITWEQIATNIYKEVIRATSLS